MASKIKIWLEEHSYEKMAHRFLAYLDKKQYYTAHMAFTSILFEFTECLKYVIRFLLGYKPHFNFYGLNPKKLSPEQSKYDPVILLHGNHVNQSTWLSLASTLSKQYKGPVFTVNLPGGNYTQKDIDIIETKITDIKKLYNYDDPNEVVTHFVGHSRGAWLAQYMSINQTDWCVKEGNILQVKDEFISYRPDVGKVIMMASGKKPAHYDSVTEVANKFRYIHGTKDLLWQERIKLEEEHIADIECGHAALPNHRDTHQAICKWLNEPYKNLLRESEGEVENVLSSSRSIS